MQGHVGKEKDRGAKFARVFGEDAQQEAIFDGIARPLVERASTEKNSDGLLFAYGTCCGIIEGTLPFDVLLRTA